MRLAVLFSGGKDSAYALMKAAEHDKVVCLVSIISKNPESFMYHTPNINLTKLQAEAAGIPLITKHTLGEKETELDDLEEALREAKQKYKVEGVVTGAIESVYQATRVQRICDKLELWCFNPLWKKNQVELLNELLENNFKIIIAGVFASGLDESWLGRELDKKTIAELVNLQNKIGISPSGEGGELETSVLDAPFFKKKIEIIKSEKKYSKNSGVFIINDARLAKK